MVSLGIVDTAVETPPFNASCTNTKQPGQSDNDVWRASMLRGDAIDG